LTVADFIGELDIMRTIDQMIQSEVLCCVSALVSQLAGAYPLSFAGNPLVDTVEQAYELASPIPDYEETCIQSGYEMTSRPDGMFKVSLHKNGECLYGVICNTAAEAWEQTCNDEMLDIVDSEVFEHWAITDWFADKLIAAGEKVDKDFAGLCVWARTTTGQQISADSVIERIYAETHKQVD
jgi:hypothetical protein